MAFSHVATLQHCESAERCDCVAVGRAGRPPSRQMHLLGQPLVRRTSVKGIIYICWVMMHVHVYIATCFFGSFVADQRMDRQLFCVLCVNAFNSLFVNWFVWMLF